MGVTAQRLALMKQQMPPKIHVMSTVPDPTSEDAPQPSPEVCVHERGVMRPGHKIALFTGILWATTLCGVVVIDDHYRRLASPEWPLWLAVPLLLLLFGLAEVFVVHLHLRGDAHTFSMVEVPLILGLFFVDPIIVIATHTVAGAAALYFHRRQPILKLAFNAAVFASSATVAVVVFRQITGMQTELTTTTLLSGGLALATANLLSLSLIVVVIMLSTGRRQASELWSGIRFGILSNLFTISLAIMAVIVVDTHPALSWIAVVPIGGIYLANWAYTTERRRHDGLDFLYQSTRLLHQSPELDSAILGLLRHAQSTFAVKHAELIYWTNPETAPLSLAVSEGGDKIGEPDYDLRSLSSLLSELDGAQIHRATEEGPVPSFLATYGFRDAIIVPLVDEGQALGALIIADQVSEVREFDDNDLRLAETLASHAAVALENGHLEQSLEQLRILEGQLTHQATHDPLTNLANRTLFRDDLAAALDEGGGRRGAVLFVDLDDFKTVNDTLGHAAGDELLRQVADRVVGSRRQDDTVARLGGDEFAVLLPDAANVEEAEAVAEQILRDFEEPAQILGRSVQIRASIGVAVASPEGDAESIMQNADTAMYQAKSLGKNQYIRFHASMYESSLRRYNLQTDLAGGLKRNEFEAFFQPIVELATKQVSGAEALVRWRHPTLGLLSPDAFLHVAAEIGVLGDIDMIVLAQACAWLVAVDDRAPGSAMTVNVNFSPQSFRGGDLTERILDVSRRNGLDPTRVCVEITEDLMGEDLDEAIETLSRLQDQGIRVALDDFGTGYSSLSQLRVLAVDTIKIPKPFIDDLDTVDPTDPDVFAAAIVALSRALNKSVVAEGIERPEQLAALEQLGCHYGQGYLFARPMEHDAMLVFLVNQLGIISPALATPDPSRPNQTA